MIRRMIALAVLLALASCGPPAGQRYVVFFQEWSAQLDDAAKSAISAAAERVRSHPADPVFVIGFADPEGSPPANKAMSATRAQVVTDALMADGVTRDRIQHSAFGAVTFSLTSQESRRVEIVVGMP
jgi:outer membrane protein OmpA-like peptidoglycan-associated protein